MTDAGRAVFLDRDGVLNALVHRDGHPTSPRTLAEFHVHDHAAKAVREIKELGFRVFVVSNQPDIARGHLVQADLDAMSRALAGAVSPDEIVICPHDDTADCACRKPKPGMLTDLASRWHVNLSRSFMVGDTWRDVEAGRRAGCTTILVAPADAPRNGADALVSGLPDAVREIRSRS